MKKITDWKQLIRDHFQKLTFLIGMMILCVYFSAFAKNFASLSNLVNIAQQTAVIAIVAMGQTIAIAGGGIDLSVGSVVALSSVTCASLLSAGISIPVAVACALLSGIACGFVTGSIVYFGKIPPFIATMGMMSIIRGVVYVITDGVPISGLPPEFSVLGLGKLWGTVPFSVLIMVAIMLLMNIVLKRSRFGRNVFAIGSNENTAYLSGVKIGLNKVSMYAVCALCSAVAGIILTSRLVSAQPTMGNGYESNAIAAAVIGGASLSGGTGSIWGTILGAFVMGILQNGLNLIGLNYFLQQIAIGIVIIVAVLLDRTRE